MRVADRRHNPDGAGTQVSRPSREGSLTFSSREGGFTLPRREGGFTLPRREGGFTLIELMIVMLIIGVLAGIAIPSYLSSLKNAREAVLKEDLHVMRQAIDSYTMDKERAPQSLDDLVQNGYLKTIPEDPMTHTNSTWTTTTDDSLQSVDQTAGGVGDVHSGSGETGTNGQAYSSW